MVFSDPIFLLGFLPASFAIFHLLRVYVGGTASIYAVVALSMAFYAYWSIPFLLLLMAQMAVNYAIGSRIEVTRDRRTLTLAVVGNLCLLGYFKYRNFFIENISDIIGMHPGLAKLVVPLGISFHTFQQIALLVDLKKGAAKLPPPLNYVMFVLFFPQLIAGPIVLHQEMGKQVAATRAGEGPGMAWVGAGALIFAFGLFKKVCLADNIAQYADLAFSPGRSLMMSEAWVGVTAFALQLFFDFSGYSDMAVGLGLMFGFRLPNNFLVPYSASSDRRVLAAVAHHHDALLHNVSVQPVVAEGAPPSPPVQSHSGPCAGVRCDHGVAVARDLPTVGALARCRLDLRVLRSGARTGYGDKSSVEGLAPAPDLVSDGLGADDGGRSGRRRLFPGRGPDPGALHPAPDVPGVGAA